jgi:transposase
MSASCDSATLPLTELEAEVQKLREAYALLQAQHQKLQAEHQKLQADHQKLQQSLLRAERAGKRQAAPFSKNKPKKQRKKPGRKAGEQHGLHGHRPAPDPADIDETIDVPLPCQCPHCGGQEFKDLDTAVQFQEDLPQKPIRRQFTIHRGTCTSCGQRVQSRHALQTSDAIGVCASQLGPVAQAAIVYLNKHAGMSYRKISDALDKLHGLSITRGGCAQVVLRVADKLEPALIEIQEKLKDSEHITPDETGWRLGGRPVWLHAWVGDDGATCYAIDPKRSADALQRVIDITWSGTMTHDGYSSYDRFEEACHQQCVDHALRRARGLVEKHPQNAAFPLAVIALFTAALELRDRHLAGLVDAVTLHHGHEEYVSQLLALATKRYRTPEYATFANHLYNHGEQWLLFLLDPTIPATNHRAEQALKTPIVNRKVFGGNQEPSGARAQETTSSVLQTCKNRLINFVSFVSQAVCGCVGSLFVH